MSHHSENLQENDGCPVVFGAIRKAMKTIISSTAIVGVVLLSAKCASAFDTSKLYVTADVGGSFVQDTTFHQSGLSASAGFDPGVRGDIAVGYNINDSWSAEMESGAIWNSISTIGGKSVSSEGLNIDLYQVPVLANVIYKFHLQNNKWTPYLGVGIGGVYSDLSLSASGESASGSDFIFAYQAEAGIKYSLSANTQIDLGYKFFGTTDNYWTIGGEKLSSDAIFTHAILLSFTWNF